MIIELPKKHIILSDEKGEVKDGILYLHRNMFEEAMFELTYILHGHVCYYCNKPITGIEDKEKQEGVLWKSLDHLIPREFGGVSITNNLRPCCSVCNRKKGSMYPNEFNQFRHIVKCKSIRERKAKLKDFNEELSFIQTKRKYGELPSLPEEWLEQGNHKSVYVNFRLEDPIGTVYNKIARFYRKYKRIPYPIVVSANKFLLDGFNSILFMKIEGIKKIDVIKLENVIYDGIVDYTSHVLGK